MMCKTLTLLLLFLIGGLPLYASRSDQVERLQSSADAIQEILDIPEESIPADLLERSECVAIIPSMKKAAFGIGGNYGKGCLLCRQDTSWGPPIMVQLTGGSFGFQIGASATDVILLIMNKKGIHKLLESKLILGGDASVAAGPVGRRAAAETDLQMRAEILSYARSRGLFAGISLDGSVLEPDKSDNEDLYGERIDAEHVLLHGLNIPMEAIPLISLLNEYPPGESETMDQGRE